jgi:hypothetical protein
MGGEARQEGRPIAASFLVCNTLRPGLRTSVLSARCAARQTSAKGRASPLGREGLASAHGGRCPFGALHLILEDWLLPVQSSAAINGPTPTGCDDQIAIATHEDIG